MPTYYEKEYALVYSTAISLGCTIDKAHKLAQLHIEYLQSRMTEDIQNAPEHKAQGKTTT